ELALAARYGCPFFRFDERTRIPDSLRRQLHPQFLQGICAVPVERRTGYLEVVMEDPGDLGAIDQLRALAGRDQLLLRVGMRDEILAFIDTAYRAGNPIGDILVELNNDDPDRVA